MANNLPTQFSCTGSILNIDAANTGMASYGEKTQFNACLMPYQGGYQLDIYVTFASKDGAFSAKALGATLAKSIVGDSSQFIPRTINAVETNLKNAGLTVTKTESYPN